MTERRDAYETAELIRLGELSPVEAVEEALMAIEEAEPRVNAFTVVRAEEALAEARALECVDDRGPLHGVPISVKDVIWTRGILTTNGTRAYADFVPDEDAVVVERLRSAGAVVVGKTNNPELCLDGISENALFGVTRNPWDRSRTPGGSSGGAGASVACGGPLAIGSDGGGSIRIPASFCGVAGLKPTLGLVPGTPGFRGWPTLSVKGPLARSVRDLELCLSVMAGPDPRDPATVSVPPAPAPERPRIAVSEDLGFARVEPDVRAAFRTAIDRLADAGHALEEAFPETGDPTDLWMAIASAEGYASYRHLFGRLGRRAEEIVAGGARITVPEYLDALDERARLTCGWLSFFERFDLLLTPTMQMTAFPVGEVMPSAIDGEPVDRARENWCAFLYACNLTGCPAASVPCGVDRQGLPIGLQIAGPRFGEPSILRLATAWDELQPWPRQAPSLEMPA